MNELDIHIFIIKYYFYLFNINTTSCAYETGNRPLNQFHDAQYDARRQHTRVYGDNWSRFCSDHSLVTRASRHTQSHTSSVMAMVMTLLVLVAAASVTQTASVPAQLIPVNPYYFGASNPPPCCRSL